MPAVRVAINQKKSSERVITLSRRSCRPVAIRQPNLHNLRRRRRRGQLSSRRVQTRNRSLGWSAPATGPAHRHDPIDLRRHTRHFASGDGIPSQFAAIRIFLRHAETYLRTCGRRPIRLSPPDATVRTSYVQSKSYVQCEGNFVVCDEISTQLGFLGDR